MIDLFSIALTHGLILVAMWRVIFRPELDDESAREEKPAKPWLKNRAEAAAGADETPQRPSSGA